MKKIDHPRIPSNIRNFEPRIMGVDAKAAIEIVLLSGLVALTSRASLTLALTEGAIGMLLILPVRDGKSFVTLAFQNLAWMFSSHFNEQVGTPSIKTAEGVYYFVDRRRVGVCVEINAGNIPRLSTDYGIDIARTLSRSLVKLDGNILFVSVPQRADPRYYHTEESTEQAENYNRFLDYLFENEFYYRSFAVVIQDSREGASSSVKTSLERANSLIMGLSGIFPVCRLVREEETMKMILDTLRE